MAETVLYGIFVMIGTPFVFLVTLAVCMGVLEHVSESRWLKAGGLFLAAAIFGITLYSTSMQIVFAAYVLGGILAFIVGVGCVFAGRNPTRLF